VRPGSPWWGPIARRSSINVDRMDWSDVIDWCAGLAFIYCGLFAVGKVILEGVAAGLSYIIVAGAAGFVLYRSVSQGVRASA